MAILFFQFGFPRLHQVKPVEVYTRLLDQNFRGTRAVAAVALGDTADLDALNPLVKALSDQSAEVRQQAADSVRRLRHAAAAENLAGRQGHLTPLVSICRQIYNQGISRVDIMGGSVREKKILQIFWGCKGKLFGSGKKGFFNRNDLLESVGHGKVQRRTVETSSGSQ